MRRPTTHRRTKIICTLGPSTQTLADIRELIEGGMNLARLNFSHGTQAEHGRALRLVRRIAKEMGATIAVLADLQGPKIRTGLLESAPAHPPSKRAAIGHHHAARTGK